MKPFLKTKSPIAVLKIDNIDTDMIIPKQFLKTITRVGLGEKLFFEMRYENNDLTKKRSDFALNKLPFDKAKILICGNNFGCGSSREHAPWALLDFGINCVIAESFADIFYNNCFENGILPIVLSEIEMKTLENLSKNGEECEVDLEKKAITIGDFSINFDIDDFKRERLLKGLDSIGMTIGKLDEIKSFEELQKKERPWL